VFRDLSFAMCTSLWAKAKRVRREVRYSIVRTKIEAAALFFAS
jgi:hypothetical protein